ncbi:MAG: nucleotide exchange factor GrpE [Clostridia bacterium]|nr:nucleotide exchange factor GrpE [Clostridia bacterium]
MGKNNDEIKDEVEAVETEAAEPENTDEAADDKTAALEEELRTAKENLLRTAAEYANFRTRTEREKAAIYANATSDAVKEIIPIADNIDRALEASKNAPEEYRKGLDMIAAQLAKSFEKLNITSFGEVGEAFDPEYHNAISSVDSDELESDTIAMVYQKGYKIGDKIIRHAMVQTVN